MATAFVTRRTGMYRCSGLGQTKYVKAGETLSAHTDCEGGCEWEFKTEDNPLPEDATVIIGEDPYFILTISEVPQIGDILNLEVGLVGAYRVTKVDTITLKVRPYVRPRLVVEKVGDVKEGQHPHRVGSLQYSFKHQIL
jgi:hypothetical protein